MSAGSLAAASATHIVEQVSSERATHGDDRVIRAVAGAMDLVHHVLRHPSLLWKTCDRRERDERVMCALPRAMVQERRWEILRACGSKLTVVVLLDHSVDGTRTPERHEHAVRRRDAHLRRGEILHLRHIIKEAQRANVEDRGGDGTEEEGDRRRRAHPLA